VISACVEAASLLTDLGTKKKKVVFDYQEYQRRYPDFLRFRNGPIARFNRQRNIVLLDSHSLYALGLYVNQEPQNSRTREFPGLELIQNLATPLEAVSLIGLNNANGINM
jgi:hypothetical protein